MKSDDNASLMLFLCTLGYEETVTLISIPDDPDVPAAGETFRGLIWTHFVSLCGFEEGERKHWEGRVD